MYVTPHPVLTVVIKMPTVQIHTDTDDGFTFTLVMNWKVTSFVKTVNQWKMLTKQVYLSPESCRTFDIRYANHREEKCYYVIHTVCSFHTTLVQFSANS